MAIVQLETVLNRSSTLRVESGSHLRVGSLLREQFAPPRRVTVVSDRDVATHYLEPVTASLEEAGYDVKDVLVPPGEESKSLKMLGTLWDRMLDFGMDRSSLVVALGGGVVGDLAGFAAATLQRGVELVQIPTTLLAQVDSSVGGKNGINRLAGKNLVGTFLQPSLVLADPDLLGTLSEQQWRAGLAEVIKYGMIRDPEILTRLEACANLEGLREDAGLVTWLVERSIQIKAEIVRRDEREAGERAHLNFGHTVGHAIEAASEYQGVLHGEAVAVGMLAASSLAADLGVCETKLIDRLSQLLRRFELPTSTPFGADDLLPFVARDKKRIQGRERWVLVPEVGRAEIVTGPDERSVFRALQAIHRPVDDVE